MNTVCKEYCPIIKQFCLCRTNACSVPELCQTLDFCRVFHKLLVADNTSTLQICCMDLRLSHH